MDEENRIEHPKSSLELVPRMEGTLESNDHLSANIKASPAQDKPIIEEQVCIGEGMIEPIGESTHIDESITVLDCNIPESKLGSHLYVP